MTPVSSRVLRVGRLVVGAPGAPARAHDFITGGRRAGTGGPAWVKDVSAERHLTGRTTVVWRRNVANQL